MKFKIPNQREINELLRQQAEQDKLAKLQQAERRSKERAHQPPPPQPKAPQESKKNAR